MLSVGCSVALGQLREIISDHRKLKGSQRRDIRESGREKVCKIGLVCNYSTGPETQGLGTAALQLGAESQSAQEKRL